jgi:DNA-binding transcriptional MerR regulator
LIRQVIDTVALCHYFAIMDNNHLPEQPSLAELSAATGIPGRTIRFYIAQGLLAGPQTSGRTAHYTLDHVGRLQAIQKAKQEGLTLGEIRRRLDGPEEKPGSPAPAPIEVFCLCPEVTVLLRADAPARRRKRLLEALAAFSRAVASNDPSPAHTLPSRNNQPITEITELQEDT